MAVKVPSVVKRERFHLVDSEAGAVWSPRCKKALIMVTFALGRRGAHSEHLQCSDKRTEGGRKRTNNTGAFGCSVSEPKAVLVDEPHREQ